MYSAKNRTVGFSSTYMRFGEEFIILDETQNDIKTMVLDQQHDCHKTYADNILTVPFQSRIQSGVGPYVITKQIPHGVNEPLLIPQALRLGFKCNAVVS